MLKKKNVSCACLCVCVCVCVCVFNKETVTQYSCKPDVFEKIKYSQDMTVPSHHMVILIIWHQMTVYTFENDSADS